MKTNYILIIAFFFTLISCKPDADVALKAVNSKPEIARDSTIVGADKDENGCLGSAGYTWSKVNKECVQIFSGIGLAPVNTPKDSEAIFYTYVFFSEDGNLAEVFLAGAENSIVLMRSEKPNPWVFEDYKLIAKNGYQLEKAGKIIFLGDGEVGSKITGSDTPED